MSLRSEIFEQPAVLERALGAQRDAAGEIARAVARADVRAVFIAARGTSDHAAIYGKYLWGAVNRLPVGLATPSLFTLYDRPPRLTGSLVVGISQSGQSPDIVGVVAEGRRQGALTLAITNDPASPLAEQAELVHDVMAGPERAVAATKTYTAQLLAIAMLSAALSRDPRRTEELERLPGLVRQALDLDATVERVAERYRYMRQCVVLGRGYNYATAYEWSLKLKELTYVVAEPYSSADFQHGPVAIVSRGFPILAAVPAGKVSGHVASLLTKLVREHKVELLAVSNEPAVLDLAHTRLSLPADLPEWLSPLVAIGPAQLFCYHLTRAMGFDTEEPRGLAKVTETW